jgi:hypothetical protein
MSQEGSDPESASPRFGLRTRWALVTVVLMLSMVASVGELYPFSSLSIFDRYSSGQSRLLARGADGQITRVTAFDRWQCPRRVSRADVEQVYAKVKGVATYLDRGSLLYIDGHQGTPEKPETVELVLRTLRFQPDEDQPGIDDYVIATCTADAIGMDWELVKIWTIVRR